jgi:transcriptional regulator with XRE-family HTH domain
VSEFSEAARVLNALPQTIKKARTALQLSQIQVADICGVAHSTISRSENGGGLAVATAVMMLAWLDTVEVELT